MLTHTRLLELLHYDQESGVFTKKKTTHEIALPIGSIAGWKNGNGYLRMCIDGRKYFAHRLAWFYVHGVWPKLMDHINRNRGDNRIINLREASPPTNSMNVGPRYGRKIKGVHFDKVTGRWRVNVSGKKHGPRFANKTDAIICYNYHAAHLHGEFARLNPVADPSEYIYD